MPNERVETLVRTLVDHFAAFGGIPLLAVFDRPKTVALHWAKDGTSRNGIRPSPPWRSTSGWGWRCAGRTGATKGIGREPRRLGERLVLQAAPIPRRGRPPGAARAWRLEANTKLPSRATGVTPATRMAEERGRLRPLKVAPADLALRIPIFVGPTGDVIHDTHHYSMPPDAIGIAGTLYLFRDRVRIVAGSLHAAAPAHLPARRQVDPAGTPRGGGGQGFRKARQAVPDARALPRAGWRRVRLSHRARPSPPARVDCRGRAAPHPAAGPRAGRDARRVRARRRGAGLRCRIRPPLPANPELAPPRQEVLPL